MKIEISHGELLDKISILEIKTIKIDDEDKFANVKKEHEALYPYFLMLLDLHGHLLKKEYDELLKVNINSINKSEKKENLQLELSKLKSLEESFKQETEFWQETMNNRKIDLLLKIEQLINYTINELATSENYDLILYENAAYVSDEVNITKKVIERIQKLSL